MHRFSGKSSLRQKDEEEPPSGPSRQEMLQSYLEARYGSKGTKKKKKTKSQSSASSSVRIVDKDISGFVPTLDSIEVTVADPDAPVVVDAKELPISQRKKKTTKRGQWTSVKIDEDGDQEMLETTRWDSATHQSTHPQRHDCPDKGDMSPPRRCDNGMGAAVNDVHIPPPRTGQLQDEDLSPPRQRHLNESEDLSPPRQRHRNDSEDLSPPRRPTQHLQDKDMSPPRRSSGKVKIEDMPPPGQLPHGQQSSDSRSVRRSLTEGLPSGMITAEKIKSELRRKRQQDKDRLAEMEDYATGKGAQTVYRNKEGRRVTLEELQKEEAKEKKKKIKWEKVEWDGGLVQQQEAKRLKAEFDRERAKPFARVREDEDLDAMYRARRRWGDPMGHLDKKSKTSTATLDPPPVIDETNRHWFEQSGFIIPQDVPEHSWIRRGVAALSNRFNIRPGRHWDGVDRSNGFENDYSKYINECAAKDREAAAWCMEDM